MGEAGEKEMTRSIKLPQTIDVALRNIRDAKIFAMDIGGSLTKIAYYSILPLKKIIYDDQETIDEDTAVYELTEGARLHFIKFETKHIEACLDYIQKRLLGAETDMNMIDVKVQLQIFIISILLIFSYRLKRLLPYESTKYYSFIFIISFIVRSEF